MTKLFNIFLFFVLVAILAVPTTAQESTGVALANVAMPSNTFMDNFLKCMEKVKDAKTCKEVSKETMKVTKDVSKSAAKAANPYEGAVYYGTVRRRCYPSDAFWGRVCN